MELPHHSSVCAISSGAYNSSMAKKIALNDIAELIEKGFTSVASDISDIKDEIADVRREMATKEQLAALHTQVNPIEAELKHGRFEVRLGDLEDKAFGAARR